MAEFAEQRTVSEEHDGGAILYVIAPPYKR